MVVRSPIIIKGATVDGTGDPLLTKDATTSELGTVASLGSGFVSSTLTSGNIIVGNGSNVATSVAMSGDGTISNAGVFAIGTGVIVNADINASAAIDYSKLNLVGGIVNADINASAAIAYSKLNLVGRILNADINASAAIARTKIASGTAYRILANNASGVLSENAAITASRAVASDSNGQLVASTTTATQLGYLSTTTSDVQVQMNTKIASKQTNAIIQAPTVTQDGYAITWDNTAGEYTLTDPVTQGIPVGGSTRQFLGKNSGTNYDASWLTLQLSDVTNVTASASDVNLLTGQVTSGLTSAHLSYVIGATSNLQAQINNKLSSTLAQNAIFVGNASNVASSVVAGSEGQVLTITSGVPTWQTVVGTGTVTSVDVDGGTTGLSFTGGPITTTGTITASGTLIIGNGGTGLTTLGTALQYLRVNAGATALEYATLPTGLGGSTGATDNAVLRANGTGGVTLQTSELVVSDTSDLDLGITASTSGTSRLIAAKGTASDIDITVQTKGTGALTLLSSGGIILNASIAATIKSPELWILGLDGTGTSATIKLYEGPTVGSNFIGVKVANSIASNVTYTLPEAPSVSGYVLSSTTGGVMSWVAVGAGDMVLATAQTSTGKKTFQPNATFVGINAGSYAGSPSTLTDGDFWYNSSLNRFAFYQNGGTQYLATANSGASTQLAYFNNSTGALVGNDYITVQGGSNLMLGNGALDGVLTGYTNPSSHGNDLIVKGGDGGTTDKSGGHLFVKGGEKTGTGVVGNLALHVDTVSNWQSAERVMFISNRTTDPAAAIADGITLFAKDSSDGSANSTLALYTEQAPEATATFTQTHRVKVWWNGVEYWLSLDAV